jgi:Cu(I)/Ag(I) efflux system membrane fusion protein
MILRRVVPLVIVVAALAGGFLLFGDRFGSVHAPVDTEAPAAPRQLWTCGMHPQVIQDHPGRCPICGMELTPLAVDPAAPDPHAGHEAEPGVTIDPAIVQKMGVRLAPVTEGTLAVPVRAVGVLAEAEPARHDVNLRVSGWIERLPAHTEGMHLGVGDPLFDLYSPELEAAVAELIAARRARDAQGPAGDGAAAAGRVLAAAERKLALYGIPPAEVARLARLDAPPRAVTFRSPIQGHLVKKNVVEGTAVEAGMQAMRIVDHSQLWLDARVFEQDLPLVRIGQRARATLTAMPGEIVEGEVIFIHPHVDEATRSAMVRLVVPNPSLLLRPGMYASVEIATEAPAPTPLVPREAVIDTGARQIAFVAHAAGRFEPRDVTLGAEADGIVQVLAGLRPGEEVVTSGQFLLDAESRTREAIAKHLARGLAAPPSGHAGH